MNYKKILILSAVVAMPMLFADFTYKKVSGSHPGSTGAPGDQTCAKSGCHAGTVTQNNNVVNQLIFPTVDSTYTPGQTYLVKIKVNKAAIQRFGFEIQALKDQTNKNIGTWTITQSTRTQIINHSLGSDNRFSVTHKQAGTLATTVGQIEWEFNWTAPPVNEGPITLYYATNSTNNNGANSGDLIYTNQFKLQPSSGASINNEIINENDVTVFYNGNGGYFDLQYNLSKNEEVKISIIDASGKQVYANAGQNKPKGINDDKITLNGEISSGIYFVNIVAGNNRVTKKVSIIR